MFLHADGVLVSGGEYNFLGSGHVDRLQMLPHDGLHVLDHFPDHHQMVIEQLLLRDGFVVASCLLFLNRVECTCFLR